MSELLGTIKGAQGKGDQYVTRELFIFDDCLVVVRGGRSADLLSRGGFVLGLGGKALGNLAANKITAKRSEKGLELSPDALVSAHEDNVKVPLSSVRTIHLWTQLRSPKLLLTFDDGSTRRFGWERKYNKQDDVATLLRSAVGDRLVVGAPQ